MDWLIVIFFIIITIACFVAGAYLDYWKRKAEEDTQKKFDHLEDHYEEIASK